MFPQSILFYLVLFCPVGTIRNLWEFCLKAHKMGYLPNQGISQQSVFHSWPTPMYVESRDFDSTSFRCVSRLWQCSAILGPYAEYFFLAHCLNQEFDREGNSYLVSCPFVVIMIAMVVLWLHSSMNCAISLTMFVCCSELTRIDRAVSYCTPMSVDCFTFVHVEHMVLWLRILVWPSSLPCAILAHLVKFISTVGPPDTPFNFAWRTEQTHAWTELLRTKSQRRSKSNSWFWLQWLLNMQSWISVKF